MVQVVSLSWLLVAALMALAAVHVSETSPLRASHGAYDQEPHDYPHVST